MSKKITIIDYGMGNLYSVQNALRSIGAEPVVTSDAAVIAQAEKFCFLVWEPLAIAWQTWKSQA